MSNVTPLPPKESALFKRILKCYEQKLYRNGLKFAKQILSNPKFSENGETQAMKGLILNCMGRKEEAQDFVKRGLRNNLRSHICWHVFGLLQRSERKYDEAIRAYRNALKWDKDNLQILRDLSLLQIHIRDWDGYRETRYNLLTLRPTQRISWIGYGIAHHLLKEFDMAIKILVEFCKLQEGQVSSIDFDYSELLLYINFILRESGNTEEALDHLVKNKQHILDKVSFQESQGQLLMQLSRYVEAIDVYRDLLDRNPHNKSYYEFLETCLAHLHHDGNDKSTPSLSTEDKVKFYVEQHEKYPNSKIPILAVLQACPVDEFRERADKVLRKYIHKGIPPFFLTLRPLYDQSHLHGAEKISILEQIVLSYFENLESCKKFAASDACEESPVSILYTMYFLSQHYDALGDYTKALHFIEKCLEHTPTFLEAFALKGKILKHAGDIYGAMDVLDTAQSMDTADRFVNAVCMRYMLRNNMIKEAETLALRFTREGVPAMENLSEMQCMWFLIECAYSYRRQGKIGEALAKCREIERHFKAIMEDQFDFHSYTMRKMTLCSYIKLLRMEDNLRSHGYFYKAATAAVEMYIELFDHPLNDNNEENSNIENMSAAELKKMNNKLRKQQLRQQQQQKEKTVQKTKKDDGEETIKLEELIPEKLERPERPLDEALRFLEPLVMFSSECAYSHVLAVAVHVRRGKLLLACQALKRAMKCDASHPDILHVTVRFLKAVRDRRVQCEKDDIVQKILEDYASSMVENKTEESLIADSEVQIDSILTCLSVSLAKYFLNPSIDSSILLTPILEFKGKVTLKDFTHVYASFSRGDLGEDNKTPEVLSKLREKASVHLPLNTCFWDSKVEKKLEELEITHSDMANGEIEA